MNQPQHNSAAATKESLKIIQLTDPHLFADPTTIFDGINTNETLVDVIDLIGQQQENPDCILCTGDLAQDSSISTYERFYDLVGTLGTDHYWLPGNHDSLLNMEKAVGADNPCLKKHIQLAHWDIVMLNTCVQGEVFGRLADEELAFLDRALLESRSSDAHVLICLHHNPIPVHSAWLQRHCLKNPEELFAITDKYQNVKAMLFGHVHQEMTKQRNNVDIICSPSTCIQFHPTSDEFRLDDKNPAYRWLELYDNGELRTGVRRIEGKTYPVDFNSSGY